MTKISFSLALLALTLTCSGCGFLSWALQGDNGQAPLVTAVGEAVSTGLTSMETGGLWAGALALLLTAGKSAARMYSDYQTTKKKV